MPGTESSALERAVAELERVVDDTDLRSALARWRSPLAVGVAGRPGAGKSGVIDALGLPDSAEVHGVDSPDLPRPDLDHDVLALVIARIATAADLEALAVRRRGETVVVVGRPDLPWDPETVAASLPASTSAIGADRITTLREAWATAGDRAARRRDVDLLGAVERVAARRIDARSAIETFLRSPAAAQVRRDTGV